jgi:membrane-associated phospholipid phosphatase
VSTAVTERLEAPSPAETPQSARWHPATRGEMSILIVSFALLVLATDILNIRLGVEWMTLAVLLAATLITRLPAQFLRDWWFLLLGLLLWNLSGPLAGMTRFPPHLDFMMNLDRILGFGHLPPIVLQSHLAAGANKNALDYLTSITYNLHVPEPYIAAYLLWRINRSAYFVFATALLALLTLSFVTFFIFPAVPPWMASEWLGRIHGVTNRFSTVLHSYPLPFHTTPIFYFFPLYGDPVAAFPSQHAAIPFLELLTFGLVLGRKAYVWFGVWVLWVTFTIVYLGEHWVTDALAGFLYSGVIFLAVLWWFGRRGWAASI